MEKKNKHIRVRIGLAIARWQDKKPMDDGASQDALIDSIITIIKEEYILKP